jgi:WD40 repeat protein
MGEVFLARDTVLGRKVAVKLIDDDTLTTRGARERFLREARATATFNHPNIVTIYGVGEHDGRPFMALEFVDGETLSARISGEQLSVGESARIALAVADALKDAHDHRILHRDLKPQNIVLGRDGRVRVLDFGLARSLAAGSEDGGAPAPRARDEDDSSAFGTPLFMAPEQWLAEGVGPAADVWAFGVTLYLLLEGRLPFTARSVEQLEALVTGDEPPPPFAAKDVPAALQELTARCLARDAAARPSAAELVSTLAQLARVGTRPGEDENPFRGLLAFSEQHAGAFHGRDAEVSAVVEQLREAPLLPVLGPSGAGKSSFVYAGVIPRLKELGRWQVIALRPGADPFQTLAARLLGDTTGAGGSAARPLAERLRENPRLLGLELAHRADAMRTRLLLFVDQLEEAYTLSDDRETCERFVQAICLAADDAAGPVRAMFTLREDFLGRVITGNEVRQAVRQLVVLQTPAHEALVEILCQPVLDAGYDYDDPTIIDDMIASVAREPAALPLLQFTCHLLWEGRDRKRKRLTRASYTAMGGVAGALASHADQILSGLAPAEIALARALLLRLVTSDGTRQIASRTALLGGLPPEAVGVLERITAARIVSVRRSRRAAADEEVELAHESLIRNWQRLAQWLDESREDVALLGEIDQAAAMWRRRGAREDETWHGEALREVLRKIDLHRLQLAPDARAFIDAGREREGRAHRRRQRLAWTRAGGLVAIAAAALVVAALLAAKERRAVAERARAERRRAEAERESATAAFGRGDFLEARAKIREALETVDEPDARVVWWHLAQEPLEWKRGGGYYHIAISRDGRTGAVGQTDDTVHIYDLDTGAVRIFRPPGSGEMTQAVAISPDGSLVASGSTSLSSNESGHIRIWRVSDGSMREFPGDTTSNNSVAFSPDGQRLLASGTTVRLYDVASGRQLQIFQPPDERIFDAGFIPDGKILSIGAEGVLRMWDPDSGAELAEVRAHDANGHGLDVSSDGRLLMTTGREPAARLWELPSLRPAGVLSEGDAIVTRARFSPDGRSIGMTSADGTLRVWDLASRKVTWTVRASSQNIFDLRFTPDGKRILLADWNDEAHLFDVGAAGSVAAAPCEVDAIAYCRQGQLAVGCNDGTIRIVDATSGDERTRFKAHEGTIEAIACAPDGTEIVSGGEDRQVGVWSATDGKALHRLVGHVADVRRLAITPDGAHLASATFNGETKVWDLASGELEWSVPQPEFTITGLQFSPDGSVLAAGGFEKKLHLWDLAARKEKAVLEEDDIVSDVKFSPKGDELYLVTPDAVDTWTLGPTPTKTRIADKIEDAELLSVTPDGAHLLVSQDSVERCLIMDLRGQTQQTLSPCAGAVAFAPDGAHVFQMLHGALASRELPSGDLVWRTRAILASPMAALTHRGWTDGGGGAEAWRATALQADESAGGDDGRTLCVRAGDRLARWDMGADRKLADGVEVGAASRIFALAGACAGLADGKLTRYGDGAPVVLAEKVAGVAQQGGQLVFWDDERARSVEPPGAAWPIDRGVTALLPASPAGPLIEGFTDGTIVAKDPAVSFDGTPSSKVTALARGPAETIVAGFDSGEVAVFATRTGRKLHEIELAGPIVRVLVDDRGRVLAVSSLGSAATIDLSVLDEDYCALMREVWTAIPVVWSPSGAVSQAPPAGHRCRR